MAVYSSPASRRNAGPILAVLERVLPARGVVLEIASGGGEHAETFARALPYLTWQPSDRDVDALASLAARRTRAGLASLAAPIALDVLAPWPVAAADAVLAVNLLHVSPWAAAEALCAGAAALLPVAGPLVLYGPFRRNGAHTSQGNRDFDASLRQQNPDWGIRDLEQVTAAAERSGLRLDEIVAMPANNLTLVYRRA